MMNSPATSRLPPELFDHILDHLWDDAGTLAACGLTCQAWLPTTRFHLFYNVRLNDSAHYSRFEQLLDQSPTVGSYVRSLTILTSVMDPKPLRIFRKLDRVKSFRIHRWSALNLLDEHRPEELQTFFSTLETLHLEHCAFTEEDFLHVLCACPRLSALHLFHLDWDAQQSRMHPDLTGFTSVNPARIESLTLHYCSARLASALLQGPFELRLRSLDLVWIPFSSVATCMHEFLNRAGTSLEHLGLACRPVSDYGVLGHDHVDLSNNTRLTSLHLNNIYIDSRFPRHPKHFVYIPAILSSLHSDPFREIQFTFRLVQTDPASLDWTEIDENLARLTRDFPTLLVRFNILHDCDNESEVHRMVDTILGRLSMLCSSGCRVGVLCFDTPISRSKGVVQENHAQFERWLP